MTTVFFCAASFIACLLAGNRSLKHGLLALIAVGYGYGILRANYPDTWTYLMFDAGVIGLFIAQLLRPIPLHQRSTMTDLRLWLTLLVAWPVLLFIFFPGSNLMVELVGLRGNVFLLPFLLLGARLDTDDLWWLGERLAILNMVAVAFAVVQFFVGIEQFFPRNEVTDIIYKSRDVVNRSAHRIPSSFSSAHAFSGTLVMTLPLLIGAWSVERQWWRSQLLSLSILMSLLGVFMAAARLHMLTAALLVVVMTVFGRFGKGQRVKWLMVLGMVAYVVAGNARLQRFTTLTETGYVSDRISGSVNQGLFDLMGQYPLGNGLAGGGTSLPYFLRDAASDVIGMENEYARIALEQGVPGLVLWLFFVMWVWTRRPWRVRDEWSTARLSGWCACVVSFGTGFIGTGLLTSVPHTVLLLLLTGWVTTARRIPATVRPRRDLAPRTSPRPLPPLPVNEPS